MALKNGIRLHFDSVLLYKNKSYATAHFISVVAMEEIGKGYAGDFYAWNCKVNPRPDPNFEEEWLISLFSNHRHKQLAFMRNVFHNSPDMRKFYSFVFANQLDTLKQNSVYV